MFSHLLSTRVAHASPKDLAKKDPSTLTREDCKQWLEQGLDNYPPECKLILDATIKTGALARRKSSVGRTWSAKDGHGNRSVVGENPDHVGVTVDKPKDGKPLEQIVLEQKTPEVCISAQSITNQYVQELEKIAHLKMRTLSRGGMCHDNVQSYFSHACERASKSKGKVDTTLVETEIKRYMMTRRGTDSWLQKKLAKGACEALSSRQGGVSAPSSNTQSLVRG